MSNTESTGVVGSEGISHFPEQCPFRESWRIHSPDSTFHCETHIPSSELLDKPSRLSDTQMAPSEQFGHHLLFGRQDASVRGSCLSHICRTGLPGQLAPKSIASPAKELGLNSSSLQPGCGLGIINNTVQTARWTVCLTGWWFICPNRDSSGNRI